MGTVPIPVSAPTSTFHLTVVPANIATSIPYRQYCFAYELAAVDCHVSCLYQYSYGLYSGFMQSST